MPHEFRGEQRAPAGKLAIVVSRYNQAVTSRLLSGALETLAAHGVPDQAVDVAWVPGAFELPLAASRMAHTRRYQAIICLGAVVRGETTHDQHINRAVSLELARLAAATGLPVLFGLLTCESLEQAFQRAGGSAGNKGSECALAALEMISLLEKLGPAPHGNQPAP
ncbi:MAG: 6,7-dimethyl-8-ribityllumazine synthase [Pirellulales bacterium]|nr:6,7-dimethyl-8-ribityllumazine synthase [Pirellulales bacterium]